MTKLLFKREIIKEQIGTSSETSEKSDDVAGWETPIHLTVTVVTVWPWMKECDTPVLPLYLLQAEVAQLNWWRHAELKAAEVVERK